VWRDRAFATVANSNRAWRLGRELTLPHVEGDVGTRPCGLGDMQHHSSSFENAGFVSPSATLTVMDLRRFFSELMKRIVCEPAVTG